MTLLSTLSTFVQDDEVRVVCDTPKGSANKYRYGDGFFELAHVLPAGLMFPFDFGFLPSTLGEDGDALDVRVLMEHAAFAGCLLRARLLGAIVAEKRESAISQRSVDCSNLGVARLWRCAEPR